MRNYAELKRKGPIREMLIKNHQSAMRGGIFMPIFIGERFS